MRCKELTGTSSTSDKTMSTRKRPDPGITGQDGSYLAELLLEKGYRMASTPTSSFNTTRIDHVQDPHELDQRLRCTMAT